MRKLEADALDAVLGQYRGAGGHGDVSYEEVPTAPTVTPRDFADADLARELAMMPAEVRAVLGQYTGARDAHGSSNTADPFQDIESK